MSNYDMRPKKLLNVFKNNKDFEGRGSFTFNTKQDKTFRKIN